MTEAEEKALKILKQVMEEKVNSTNVEVCVNSISAIFQISPYSFCRWHQLK